MTDYQRSAAIPRAGLALTYLILVSAALYLILSGWAYDDPFITYRYARNISQGAGFVYNLGEHVLSTTTPLFTILLAGLYRFSPDLPRIANLIGAVSLAAGALLIWDLANTWQTQAVGWAGLLLYPTFILPAAAVGSETPLYIALCLAAFAFFAHRRYSFSALWAALSALTRPDGVLVLLVLAGDYLLRYRRLPPWRAILIYTAVILPWFVFAWIYFGSPLPVTLAAKQQQGNLVVSQYFAPGMLWILSWFRGGWQYWLELLLAASGIYWLFRSARSWGLVLSWTGLYFIAYSLLRISRYFWYYAPLVPGFIILVGLGIEAVTHFLRAKIPAPSQSATTGAGSRYNLKKLAYAPNLLAVVLLVSLTTAQLVDLWKLRLNLDPRASIYRAVGNWLQANTPPGAWVGSLEAGIIGYYADRPMVDFAGLLKPDVARQMVAGATYDEVAAWAMRNYAPRYVVLVSGDLQDLKTGYINQNCRAVQQFSAEVNGSMVVSLYACP